MSTTKSSSTLRREVIKLAHTKPELRKHLLPILASYDPDDVPHRQYEMRFELTTPMLNDEDDAAKMDLDSDDGKDRSYLSNLQQMLDTISNSVDGERVKTWTLKVKGIKTDGGVLTLVVVATGFSPIDEDNQEKITDKAIDLMEDGIKEAFNSGPIGEWAFHEDKQPVEVTVL